MDHFERLEASLLRGLVTITVTLWIFAILLGALYLFVLPLIDRAVEGLAGR